MSLLWLKPFSGSAQSMFLNLASKMLQDLLWPPNCSSGLIPPTKPFPVHYTPKGRNYFLTNIYFVAFIHVTLQNPPVLLHQLQSPAQLDPFSKVLPALLTMDSSSTTSVPYASYANVLYNHSIKEYPVQIAFLISWNWNLALLVAFQ